jgi:gas vesicle protein
VTDYERSGDYQPSEEKSTFGVALTFLLIGLGAGALSALLFAPRSGKQMRRLLRRKYEDALENISDTAEDWKERSEDFVHATGSKVADIARR